MQLNDALIESYRAEIRTLDNLLEDDRGLPEIGCKGESSIPTIVMQAHRLYTFLLSGRETYNETLEGSRDCEGEFQ